jgi:predicted urease superfamily metal-dependent hydrolase
MTELHDRQSMERLHQHLARAGCELQDAQHFLDPGSSAAAEMDIVRAVAAARLTVEMALERVRSQLGEPEP